ncbi:MAG: hypothetical protein AB7N99_09365 [Simkaniaceae bacterium]
MKQKQDGIIVATSEEQEWLLIWWWNHYHKHNNHPVTFFDLGMSKSARLWCEKRGQVFSFSPNHLSPVSPAQIHQWNTVYLGDVSAKRPFWLVKPSILINSPYERTIWIDLDCEVKKSISSLFDYCNTEEGLSLLKITLGKSHIYNSGVIVAKRHSPLLKKWVETIDLNPKKFLGDEAALLELLKKNKQSICSLPIEYNWPNFISPSPQTAILHHMLDHGKTNILRNHDFKSSFKLG